jgi:hypothetical protein
MRAVVIWITGLAAFSIIGSLAGFSLSDNRDIGEHAGAAAGACLFICLRLWIAKPTN